MKFTLTNTTPKFEPVIVAITFESAEEIKRMYEALGRVGGSDGFYEFYTKLGELKGGK